jgi:4-amino-4-deoxy-L-arabinose transferase-like glycosyltransferase
MINKIINYLKDENKSLLIIFLIAILLRGIYILQNRTPIISDEIRYNEEAINILEGEGFSWRTKGKVYKSFNPPFYPFFLTLVYLIFGINPEAARVIQAFLGSLSCLIIYFIGKRAFNKTTGLLASFMLAIYGGHIFINRYLLTETLFMFLVLLAILLLLQFKDTQKKAKLIISGILIGLGILTRGQLLLFIPFIFIWFYSLSKKFKEVAINFSIFLAFSLLIVIPWTIRNYLIHKEFVLINTYVRGNPFYLFNHPSSNPELVWNIPQPHLSEVEEERYFYKLLFDFIKRDPKFYFLNWYPKKVRKSFYFFCIGDPPYELRPIAWFYSHFPLTIIIFGIPLFVLSWKYLFFLSVIGIILSFKRWNTSSLFYYFILTQSIIIIFILNGAPRYRLPVTPIFILFAAYSISLMLSGALKEMDKRKEDY